DQRDANRAVSPLRPADDAVVVDCSSMSIDEMLDCAVEHVREKGLVG
ncbi:MAG TPA: cytidylate kinase, partial [Gammaproteobacteria bacterium]|nr:cytidylate kinase [Gammaproteobacteria bacterium]